MDISLLIVCGNFSHA